MKPMICRPSTTAAVLLALSSLGRRCTLTCQAFYPSHHAALAQEFGGKYSIFCESGNASAPSRRGICFLGRTGTPRPLLYGGGGSRSRSADGMFPFRLSFKTPGDSEDGDLTQNIENSVEDGTSRPGILSLLPIIFPLLLVYISNQWSRSSLYYLVNFSDSPSVSAYTAMNVDLSFSEAEYGVLASVAFTALFAIASLVAGSLSDRSDRKLLTVGAASAWSVATISTAASSGYGQVLVARVFMGLACAFATPSAYTLIRDLVPADRTALANSVYGSGVYFGGALASLSILLDENLGWRGALGTIGAYGLATAALATVVLPQDPTYEKRMEEERLAKEATATEEDAGGSSSSLLTDASEVLSTSVVRWLFLGSFLRFCSGLCIGVWAAPYFRLTFPDNASSYAVINALIVSLCGVASGVGGGWASDRVGSAAIKAGFDEGSGRLAVPVVGSVLAAPAWWLTMSASTFNEAMLWLGVEYLVAECWFGPVIAVLQSKVGPKKGGTAQGMFTLTGAIGNLAPTVLGTLYGEATAHGADNGTTLSGLLSVGVCAGYILSATCFALSARAADDGRRSTSLEENNRMKVN